MGPLEHPLRRIETKNVLCRQRFIYRYAFFLAVRFHDVLLARCRVLSLGEIYRGAVFVMFLSILSELSLETILRYSDRLSNPQA